MKPEILHIGKGYWPSLGGMETITRQLSEGAVSDGFDVRVLTFGDKHSQESVNSVNVVRVPTLCTFARAPISHIFRRVMMELVTDADIVHFHYPNPLAELTWMTIPSSVRKKKFCVCSYQSDPLRPRVLLPFYTLMTHMFLNQCDSIVASSSAYRDSSPILNPFKDRVRVIPLGVDVKEFKNVGEEDKKRIEEILSDMPSPRILFSGRFVYYKGLEYLLQAMEKVKGVSCILVGDGPCRRNLEKRATQLGISERVLFTGHLEDGLYKAIFGRADLFVLPSVFRTEAFGLVALEAMAAGLPVITTELGTATSVYNREGITGYVVDPFNVPELADRIALLAEDPELRTKMGNHAREHVRKNYSAELMVQRYLDLYRNGL